MPTASEPSSRRVRICVCVLMNHPYPKNIPLLRKIYKDRFAKVLFLVPFERLPDEDVVTVYRGSYNHSGYLVDAAERIKQIDCDYVLVTHDDVLINPKLSEETFLSTFPLERDEGFIPLADFNKDEYGSWTWYYGVIPKFLYPMSFIFGTGVEAATLRRFLPDPDDLRRKFDAANIEYTETLKLVSRDPYDHIPGLASQLAILGRSGGVSSEKLDRISLALKASLFDAVAEAEHQAKQGSEISDVVDLPLPITFSKAFTDFYIVPQSSLGDFIHFVGVAAAANLFVEVMTPVALFAACSKVRIARDFGLDFQFGFMGRSLREMLDPRLVAVHSVKLSLLANPAQQANFLSDLDALKNGSNNLAPQATVGRQDLGNNILIGYLSEGWHGAEPWGRWSCQKTSKIEFGYQAGSNIGAMRVNLVAVLHPMMPVYKGTLTVNGAEWPDPLSAQETAELEIVIPAEAFKENAINVVEITSERVWTPHELDPSSLDGRSLGVGITGLEFTSAVDIRVPSI